MKNRQLVRLRELLRADREFRCAQSGSGRQEGVEQAPYLVAGAAQRDTQVAMFDRGLASTRPRSVLLSCATRPSGDDAGVGQAGTAPGRPFSMTNDARVLIGASRTVTVSSVRKSAVHVEGVMMLRT